ncbi:MAG: O-antigen ligase family protein [Candidatus Izemoplasma sp.]|nr:O-antigen ligase family protein [Candidatus Izemoplasma sp.]
MKQWIKNGGYDIYLIALLAITFFSYIYELQTYFLVFIALVGIVNIVLKNSIFYVIPVPFFVQMSFSDLRDNVEITTVYTVILTFLIVFDMIQNRTITKRGRLTFPLVLLLIVSVVTHVNSPDLFTTFAGFMQVASVLGLYFYFVNTIDDDEKNITYIAKILMYLGALVTLEMVYFIIKQDMFAIDVIRRRMIHLGWENINLVIYANIISIPLIAYLISHSKIKFYYMFFALLNSLGILLTLSRSSLLTLGVFIIVLVPIMILYEDHRFRLLLHGCSFLLFFAITLYIAEEYELVSQYIEAVLDRDLTYVQDRIELLKIAWSKFKAHPILGSGGLYSSRIHISEAGNAAVNYHNTIAQASTLGTIGLIGFLWLFMQKTRVILQKQTSFKWFVLALIYITAFVNGMFQPMYFYTTYMIYIFLVLAVIENVSPTLKK